MQNTIYKVTTEGDVEGRSIRTLGFCTGNPIDIKRYFEDQKYYELFVEPITVKHISPEVANEKEKLLEEKKTLENRLKQINDSIY